MLISKSYSPFIFICCVLFAVSCSDTVEPDKQEEFSGITQTDEANNFLGGDTTDWQPHPVYVPLGDPTDPIPRPDSLIQSGVDRAYPNPVTTSTNLQFSLAEEDSVWIYVYKSPGYPPVDTVFSQTCKRGQYYVLWSPQLSPGIYRVKFYSVKGLSSHGDIQILE